MGLTVKCSDCDFEVHPECSLRTDNGLVVDKWTKSGFKYFCPKHFMSTTHRRVNSNQEYYS